MRLQTKVLLILGFVWIAMSFIIYLDSQYILKNNYTKLENELIEQNINDVNRAFNRMIESLTLYTVAWSVWDEGYKFMKDKNKKFIASNFVPGTFTSSRNNFFMFYDTNAMFYYGKAYDFNTNKMTPVPQELKDYLYKNWEFVTHGSLDSRKFGILNTENGLIVMASLPILTGNSEGPSRGTVLMGYYLTKSQFNILSSTVGLKLKFFKIPFENKNPILEIALSAMTNNPTYYVYNINEHLSLGYILLRDINNQPIGLIQIEIPRDIYAEGVSTTKQYLLLIIIFGIIVLISTWILLRIFVLNRLLNVSKQVINISQTRKFDNKIIISGNDELQSMVDAINKMMMMIMLSQNKLRYMAHHDHLTGLPNRILFYELLSQEIANAISNNTKIAILFIDMDKFKEINDNFGHDIGDKVLVETANRLKDYMHEKGAVSRSAGDEFVLYFKNVQSLDILKTQIMELLTLLSKEIILDEIIIKYNFSAGISIFPDNGQTIETLLKAADHAMYAAKHHGGNNYHFYCKNDDMLI